MSKLRPECRASGKPATFPSRLATLRHIYTAVARRRSLGYGALDTEDGKHCAMGCLWDDEPGTVVMSEVVDEVAAVNDSVPPTATPKQRWNAVMRWLRYQLGE